MASTYKMVAYGSQGDAVRQLQGELNKHGYQLNEDGIFGKKTRSAVRDYQRKNNLRLDGIAGDETWGSLMAPAPAEPEAPPAHVAKPSARTARELERLEKGYTPSADVTAAPRLRQCYSTACGGRWKPLPPKRSGMKLEAMARKVSENGPMDAPSSTI